MAVESNENQNASTRLGFRCHKPPAGPMLQKNTQKCIKKQNDENAKKKVVVVCNGSSNSSLKQKEANRKDVGKKKIVVESRFPVWHYAFGLSYKVISATEFNCVGQQRTWQRW